jgi:hypothetical protein
MEIQKDGTVINPALVCVVPYCTNDSAVRLTEVPEFAVNRRPQRRDLCVEHAEQTIRVYKEKVEVLAVWNGEEMENWDE